LGELLKTAPAGQLQACVFERLFFSDSGRNPLNSGYLGNR
jgi:hypothetical protein